MSNFTPEFLDEIRRRVSIADVVGRTVRLKERARGDFWGLSPFTKEKTPSFSVNPSLQDVHAMQDLVDGSGGVDFAVLFISRLRWYWRFDCSAHLFVRGHPPSMVTVTRVARYS